MEDAKSVTKQNLENSVNMGKLREKEDKICKCDEELDAGHLNLNICSTD